MLTLEELLETKHLAPQKRNKTIAYGQETEETKYSETDFKSCEERCLEEREDLLSLNEANNLDQQSSSSHEQSKADSTPECWTQCMTWEACALGGTPIHQPSYL